MEDYNTIERGKRIAPAKAKPRGQKTLIIVGLLIGVTGLSVVVSREDKGAYPVEVRESKAVEVDRSNASSQSIQSLQSLQSPLYKPALTHVSYAPEKNDDRLTLFGPGFVVARSQWGSGWPWRSVDEAVLRCKRLATGQAMVTVELNDDVYGLNDVALGIGGLSSDEAFRYTTDLGYPQVRGVDDLRALALNLCYVGE